MSIVNGEFMIFGLSENDPNCIRSADELVSFVHQMGFLPLFGNEIPGFSVEEHTPSDWWFTDSERYDPWKWREQIAGNGELVYGKFFGKRAGFISREWFPTFANFRRDGYDFESLYEDEKAPYKQKVIMDFFPDEKTEMFSYELKKALKKSEYEKSLETILTALQMQTYLCISDFRRKQKKNGEEYGWPRSVYSRPEHILGYDAIASGYSEKSEESGKRIEQHLMELYPDIPSELIRRFLKVK